jgi:hypothetical protein
MPSSKTKRTQPDAGWGRDPEYWAGQPLGEGRSHRPIPCALLVGLVDRIGPGWPPAHQEAFVRAIVAAWEYAIFVRAWHRELSTPAETIATLQRFRDAFAKRDHAGLLALFAEINQTTAMHLECRALVLGETVPMGEREWRRPALLDYGAIRRVVDSLLVDKPIELQTRRGNRRQPWSRSFLADLTFRLERLLQDRERADALARRVMRSLHRDGIGLLADPRELDRVG